MKNGAKVIWLVQFKCVTEDIQKISPAKTTVDIYTNNSLSFSHKNRVVDSTGRPLKVTINLDNFLKKNSIHMKWTKQKHIINKMQHTDINIHIFMNDWLIHVQGSINHSKICENDHVYTCFKKLLKAKWVSWTGINF